MGDAEGVIGTCAVEGRGSPASPPPPPPLLGQGSALSRSRADSQGQPSLGSILSAQELPTTIKEAGRRTEVRSPKMVFDFGFAPELREKQFHNNFLSAMLLSSFF